VISYLAMEAPSSTWPEAIRDEQAKVLRTVRPLTPERLVRGQFRGYHQEPGVATDSRVPTFAAVQLAVDSWRWEGVPFYIRAGKCLQASCTEVVVELKQAPPVVFQHAAPRGANYIRFRLAPEVAIDIGAYAKNPGEGLSGRPVELSVVSGLRQGSGQRLEAYERLLGDAMLGDATLFARQDVVEAAWAVVDPVLGDAGPLTEYDCGTWGPPDADRLVAGVGGWAPI
jgi:glucose-6-phosphate 1-dehydrogenase